MSFRPDFHEANRLEALRKKQQVNEARNVQYTQKLHEISGARRDWDAERFKKVLILASALETYIPATQRPDSITFDKLSDHALQLQALSVQNGHVESSRTFFTDIEKATFLQGRTVIGEAKSVQPDWRKQPGREQLQYGVMSMHVHPDIYLDNGKNPLSPSDFRSALLSPELIGDVIVMGKHLIVILKTSVTVRHQNAALVDDLIGDIEAERVMNVQSSSGVEQHWKSMEDAIRANKDMSTAFGLMYYLGKITQPGSPSVPLKRVVLNPIK